MNFFKRMFSGDNTSSYGRWASYSALTCLLIWSSLLVNKACAVGVTLAELKAAIPDIPTNWLAVVCIPFAISKAPDIIAAAKGVTNGDNAAS